jgi:hypothetical protein
MGNMIGLLSGVGMGTPWRTTTARDPKDKIPAVLRRPLDRENEAAAREQGLPLAADASGAGDERSAGSADA